MKYYSNFVPAYCIIARVADFTDQYQVHFYRNEAEALLGVTPTEFIQMSPASQQFLLNEKRKFRSLAMEIEATYNGSENRLSYTCKKIYQGD